MAFRLSPPEESPVSDGHRRRGVGGLGVQPRDGAADISFNDRVLPFGGGVSSDDLR